MWIGIEEQLFLSFAPIVVAFLDTVKFHHLSIIGWSYAISDVDVPGLFNSYFVNLVISNCAKKKERDLSCYLSQLHQWNLWQTKEKMHPRLPASLQHSCYKAFNSWETQSSLLQDDVVSKLTSIGLEPIEDVVMLNGYSIDALVIVDCRTIGIEVDGPSHFIGRSRSPLGATKLKRRQVQSVDGIELVSVPYWEWDELRADAAKKQKYLQKILGLGDKNTVWDRKKQKEERWRRRFWN